MTRMTATAIASAFAALTLSSAYAQAQTIDPDAIVEKHMTAMIAELRQNYDPDPTGGILSIEMSDGSQIIYQFNESGEPDGELSLIERMSVEAVTYLVGQPPQLCPLNSPKSMQPPYLVRHCSYTGVKEQQDYYLRNKFRFAVWYR